MGQSPFHSWYFHNGYPQPLNQNKPNWKKQEVGRPLHPTSLIHSIIVFLWVPPDCPWLLLSAPGWPWLLLAPSLGNTKKLTETPKTLKKKPKPRKYKKNNKNLTKEHQNLGNTQKVRKTLPTTTKT